ncbi:hypothetical protein, partial [Streptomyces mexicanus]|uniref:hypothetical protein n=1 Tax=Streptomyces mexicanus TaxID=178566 RepID=UPI0031EE2DC9
RRPRGVCMSELLASCAAAAAISRPPRAPDPPAPTAPPDHHRSPGRAPRPDPRTAHRPETG